MKKEIIEQLHKIAVEILKRDTNDSWDDLQKKSRKLYEKITLQAYLSSQKGITTVAKDANKSIPEMDSAETIAEPLIEKIKDIVAQMPSETTQVDDMLDEIIPQKPQKSDLDDFAQHYKETPVFERKEIVEHTQKPDIETATHSEKKAPEDKNTSKKINDIPKKKSLNDKLNTSIHIGLNDRLAFTKHLFNQNADDYHRVINQIATFETLEETKNFIETMVKPEYDWNGKEIYAERLFSLIEKKFD